MNEYPLVSLTIPTYQGEEFLEETLSTAISQAYPNIEIIISDDGSTDRTIEIAKNFQKKSSLDFKIFTHHRLGLVDNWNFCISMARGKYIKFLFQDDLLQPNCIEEMVILAEKEPEIGLVFSPRGIILAKGADDEQRCLEVYKTAGNLHESWSNLKSVQTGQELLQDPNFFQGSLNKIGEPSTVLIKKEVFDKIGGFDNNLCQLIDVDMWLRIMSYYKIGFIDKKLSYFRIHPQQQTLKNLDSGELILDDHRFLNKILTDPCYGLLPQNIKQEVYYRKITAIENDRNDARSQLERAKERIQQLETELSDAQSQGLQARHQLDEVKDQLDKVKEIIVGMESSKFWQIRNTWFTIKRLLNLPIDK